MRVIPCPSPKEFFLPLHPPAFTREPVHVGTPLGSSILPAAFAVSILRSVHPFNPEVSPRASLQTSVHFSFPSGNGSYFFMAFSVSCFDKPFFPTNFYHSFSPSYRLVRDSSGAWLFIWVFPEVHWRTPAIPILRPVCSLGHSSRLPTFSPAERFVYSYISLDQQEGFSILG